MAKGSGGAGRGSGSGGKKRKQDNDGWSTSVWDVRRPGETPQPQRARPAARAQQVRRNAAGGVAVTSDFGYGRNITAEMRDLQRRVRTAARERGYRDDDPIPGTNGLTLRNLRRNAASRGGAEGALRAALQALRSGNTRGGGLQPLRRI